MQLLITGPNGASSTVTLSDKSLSLGRAVDNDLPYPEDPALSRRHLCIDRVPGGWTVKDCGSRNGTILNDEVLEAPRLLKSGDRILVGHLTIEVESEVNEPSPTPRNGPGSPRASTISTTLDEVLGQHGLHAQATNFG